MSAARGIVSLFILLLASRSLAQPFVYLGSWGSSGSGLGQFSSPDGVAAWGSQFVYVSDQHNFRIQKFSTSGVCLGAWSVPSLPVDLAVGPDGSVFVPFVNENKVRRYDGDGTLISEWGVPGSGDGQLQYPEYVGVDGLRHVYLTQAFSSRLQKFDANGGFLMAWGLSGQGGELAVDMNGNLYVGDFTNNVVQKFSADGNLLDVFGGPGVGDGQFTMPVGIGTDAAGRVYVVDSAGADRVQVFDGGGNFLSAFGAPGDAALSYPFDVTVDANGIVYVCDIKDRIARFGEAPTPVRRTTWGRVKSLYR